MRRGLAVAVALVLGMVLGAVLFVAMRRPFPCLAGVAEKDGVTVIEVRAGCHFTPLRGPGWRAIWLVPDSLGQMAPVDTTHRPARTVPLPEARKT